MAWLVNYTRREEDGHVSAITHHVGDFASRAEAERAAVALASRPDTVDVWIVEVT